jgi:iron(III) transport system substrate-binding protein
LAGITRAWAWWLREQKPETAKLFIHYLLSAEGIAPQGVDGKMSTNQTVKLPADEASGIEKYRGELMEYLTATVQGDWEAARTGNIWSLNYKNRFSKIC